jgi:YbbR domain-containing protein
MRRRFDRTRILYMGISVGIATVMWLYVATTQNPVVERVMTLDVHVRGLSAAEVLRQMPTRVLVEFRGPRSALVLLTPSRLDASIDLAGLRPGKYDVPVQVETPPGVHLRERAPADASVVLDRLMRERFVVRVDLIGTPPQGVTPGTAHTRPGHVLVSGAATQVEEVRHAVVFLDTSGLRQPLAASVPVHLLDAASQQGHGLRVEPSIVRATLPVHRV